MANKDLFFMKLAISKAKDNLKDGSKPFGALIVHEGVVVSSYSNGSDRHKDPTAHAEIEVIRQTSRLLRKKYLQDCILYTTCEPCLMCLGAILWAKIPQIVVGLMRKNIPNDIYDIIYKDSGTWVNKDSLISYPLSVKIGYAEEECLNLFEEYKKILKS